jgi:hypothetical protein
MSCARFGLNGTRARADAPQMIGDDASRSTPGRLPSACAVSAAFAQTESVFALSNGHDGTILRLLVDDEPSDPRDGPSSTTNERSTCATASCAARCAGCRRSGAAWSCP